MAHHSSKSRRGKTLSSPGPGRRGDRQLLRIRPRLGDFAILDLEQPHAPEIDAGRQLAKRKFVARQCYLIDDRPIALGAAHQLETVTSNAAPGSGPAEPITVLDCVDRPMDR